MLSKNFPAARGSQPLSSYCRLNPLCIYGADKTIRVFNILTMDMLFFIPFLWYDFFNKSTETHKLSAL